MAEVMSYANLAPFKPRKPRGTGSDTVERQIVQWTDGSVWKIVQGEDFVCEVTSMRGTLSSWASRHGYRVRTSTRYVPKGTILVQFFKRED